MAKVAFTKLGLAKNTMVKKLDWNGQEIEVKQYLPTSEVLDLVAVVINKSYDGENNFSNPIKVNIYTTLEILYNYTNINFTEKQKEDVLKLYDLVTGSGLYDNVKQLIPKDEYDRIITSIEDTITAIYTYQHSLLGILDTVSTDYNNLNLDIEAIQAKIADKDNLELLKTIMDKLG